MQVITSLINLAHCVSAFASAVSVCSALVKYPSGDSEPAAAASPRSLLKMHARREFTTHQLKDFGSFLLQIRKRTTVGLPK